MKYWLIIWSCCRIKLHLVNVGLSSCHSTSLWSWYSIWLFYYLVKFIHRFQIFIYLLIFKNLIWVSCRSLPYHRLSGSLSRELGKLDHLKVLYVLLLFLRSLMHMSIIRLVGKSNASNLSFYRALHDNNFYGTIPSELGNCSQLQGV